MGDTTWRNHAQTSELMTKDTILSKDRNRPMITVFYTE
jgi:hypothetical protein